MGSAAKREYRKAIQARYRCAGKREKGRILDEFCRVCQYHRKYAVRLLNSRPRRRRARLGPAPQYSAPELRAALERLWRLTNYSCGKRLSSAIPLWLPFYEQRYGELPAAVRRQLRQISPATIDRLLKPVRGARRRGRGGTKPGTLLKQQIPVRGGSWDVSQPGYLEADTVAHCGDSLAGDFVWSINLTDILSGWTETRAVWNKGARGVLRQIADVEQGLPFTILGFDCDNGSEFLNYHLADYFLNRQAGRVAFTRSRPYRKNDNAHVEQKNWTHVRKLVGYDRLGDPRCVDLLNDLYANAWNPLLNFFTPVMKLTSKERVGAKLVKRYDQPQTPCQRLLASGGLSAKAQRNLKQALARLNPLELREAVEDKLQAIATLLSVTANVRQ
jgi:hypothetical protein